MGVGHRPRRSARAVIAAGLVAVVSACGGGGPGTEPPSGGDTTSTQPTSGADVATLPTGKDDLALPAGRYRSPDGFSPAMVVTIDDRWTSVHRGADGFDLGRSVDPGGDLLVAVALLVPPEASAADAIEALRPA